MYATKKVKDKKTYFDVNADFTQRVVATFQVRSGQVKTKERAQRGAIQAF